MKELKVAKLAAKEAGAILKKHYGRNFSIKMKGEIDIVTEIDEKCQKKIQKIIKKHFPKDAFLAEEGDAAETKSAERRWIVDPLDGTVNFTHNYPKFCVSIAFEKNQKLEVGVIYDPIMDELFYARAGKGAFLNGKRIKPRKPKSLKESMLVTGFPYDLHDPKSNNLPIFSKMLFDCRAIRRDGSAALDLAYTACGRFDGFWELTLKAWDQAAGLLMLQEVGIEVRAISDSMHAGYPRDICAAPKSILPELHSRLLELSSHLHRISKA